MVIAARRPRRALRLDAGLVAIPLNLRRDG